MARMDLLVPQWLLEEKRWVELLSALEEVVSDIESNIEELKKLFDPYECEDYLENAANQFSFGTIQRGTEEINRVLLDIARGFIELKSSLEFFTRLFRVFDYDYEYEDLSKKTLILSYQGAPSASYIQDGKRYRDGSIEITVPISIIGLAYELAKFVSAGVYVWYNIITGVVYFMSEMVPNFCYTVSGSTRLRSESEALVVVGVSFANTFENDLLPYAKHSGYYFISNEGAVTLM